MICHQCGKAHSIDEIELSYRRPDEIANMPADQRERLVKEDDDLCAISGQRFFARAVLPLPVAGREEPYNIGLWVEVEKSSFKRLIELWSIPDQDSIPPFTATLANDIAMQPSTIGLAVELYLTGTTTRPRILLRSTGHPLFDEQSKGISAHRAHEYTALVS